MVADNPLFPLPSHLARIERMNGELLACKRVLIDLQRHLRKGASQYLEEDLVKIDERIAAIELVQIKEPR